MGLDQRFGSKLEVDIKCWQRLFFYQTLPSHSLWLRGYLINHNVVGVKASRACWDDNRTAPSPMKSRVMCFEGLLYFGEENASYRVEMNCLGHQRRLR